MAIRRRLPGGIAGRPTPQVGDRVLVRRRLPDTPGHLTDVIGHVASLKPLVILPQSVGGLRSAATAITIDHHLVEVIKVLAPQPVRNADIRAVEQATAQAFPGIAHRRVGDWLLRAGDGITERSNSSVPVGPGAAFQPVPIAAIREFYATHQLPPRLLIPDRIGAPAEVLISTEPGWELGPDIVVMTRPLQAPNPGRDYSALHYPDQDTNPLPAAHHAALAERYTVHIDDQPSSQWLALYHFRGQPLPTHALDLLRQHINGQMCFASLIDRHSNEVVAITRGTITASDDGRTWLGYSAVEVIPHARRQGLGTYLGQAMLEWGATHNAEHALLQVVSSNTAGISLYRRLGFAEHHRHRCAIATS
ncbi:GNAT family N-acetyltransferase [Corynebacterium choanae]|uniref:Mycothiol acetyltransferase n=1 Tax=Corynebacterium choanae TaxID=1862358 RepID=A0A3G6J427_9CORY|nr:GNAT family N-acetyltransferase [Corynebacterium choanae]AZA12696.1 Mycothiol acetyltransferase [Corynebacterium choanae]